MIFWFFKVKNVVITKCLVVCDQKVKKTFICAIFLKKCDAKISQITNHKKFSFVKDYETNSTHYY